jgi:hypothetical protein
LVQESCCYSSVVLGRTALPSGVAVHTIPLTPDSRIIQILDLLYEAAADAEKWTIFLQALADTIDASHAAILFNNYNDQRYNVAFQLGFDDET